MTKNNETFQATVERRIGYEFQNQKLLRQAFVRKSYSSENGGEDNENLEFIGDKVLDIAVVRYLIKKYGNELHPENKMSSDWYSVLSPIKQTTEEFKCELNEGELTRLKQRLVEKKALASRVDDLDLSGFLIMGKGDRKKNASKEDSVKEDLFEALIGAVALDCDWNFNKIQSVVEVMLCPEMFLDEDDEADYVGRIYEWESEENGSIPYFEYLEQGFSAYTYHSNQNTIYQSVPRGNLTLYKYSCRLVLTGIDRDFMGYGTSKHEARKAVCKLAYQYLEENDLLYDIHDEIDNPNLEESINQLETLARRGYFKVPEYTYEESHDKDGNPIWHVECHIEGMKYSYFSEGSSKKRAKKEAAFQMLSYILDLDE